MDGRRNAWFSFAKLSLTLLMLAESSLLLTSPMFKPPPHPGQLYAPVLAPRPCPASLGRCTPSTLAAGKGEKREMAEQMCHVHSCEAEWKVTSSPQEEGEPGGKCPRTQNQR